MVMIHVQFTVEYYSELGVWDDITAVRARPFDQMHVRLLVHQ